MQTVRLKRGAERRSAQGHPWIFSNEIEEFDRSIPPGEDVVVADARGWLLGSGTFSPSSLIAVRLHTRGRAEPLGPELVTARVQAAWKNRLAWLGDESEACRVVYGEADGLPGLVVDRYGAHLAMQALTAGMDRRTGWILDALGSLLGPAGIVLRNDSPARGLEGLPLEVRIGGGRVPDRIVFGIDGLRFAADLWSGQKTGFFLDQRSNWRLMRPVARGARVLDAFCYSGAWGIHAAMWGAREVTFLDASEAALGLARLNTRHNGFENATFEASEALDYLKARAGDREFDLVVLDPPAFVKNRKRVPQALKGYLNLNKWGMRCVRPGGYLVTCSCSHHLRPEAFLETLALAAREAGREVRVLGSGGQPADHPWLPAMPETAYLKAFLLQVG